MATFTNTSAIFHSQTITKRQPVRASISPQQHVTNRRKTVGTFLATSLALAGNQLLNGSSLLPATAESWGTRSFVWEKFFEPDLSPEDSVARIRQTAEGLHHMRDMLENMSWRYVLFYTRLKGAYLDKDLKIAMATLPPDRRKDYVKKAQELSDNMYMFDSFIRTPKVYESYVYYEKSLKSIDELVAMFA